MDVQTTVVTGGSRGIGASVVRAFADSGTHVVTCARDPDALGDVAEAVRDAGGSVTVQRTNVRDEYDVEGLLETAAREAVPHLDHPVAVVDPGQVATDRTDGRGTDPGRAADLVLCAATEAPPGSLDGGDLDRRTMREA